MESSANVRKVLWAVDPFTEDKFLFRPVVETLRMLSRRCGCQLEPVYLYGGYPVDIDATAPAGVVAETQRRAQGIVDGALRDSGIPGVLPLRILWEPYLTLRAGVDQLIGYARRSEAELIVAGTHAAKGIARWFIGSFAETLMQRSTVPALVVSPWEDVEIEFGRILFGTDFSDESEAAFRRLIPFAREWRSEVTIFHKLGYLLTPALEFAYALHSTYDSLLESQKRDCRELAERWARLAAESGVKVDIIIDDTLFTSAGKALLAQAKAAPCVIALAAQSGPLSTVLLGSTTREVVRNAPCPVWVFHAEPGRATATGAVDDRSGRRAA